MAVEEAVTLQYKMRKGEELQYKVAVESKLDLSEHPEGGEARHESRSNQMEMVMIQKVTGIEADGQYGVDVTITEGWVKGLGEGEEKENLPSVGQVVSLKMKKSGEITASSLNIPFDMPSFPEDKLRPGSTWERESHINVPGIAEPITIKYHYLLEGFAKLHGYQCAEIKVNCPESTFNLGEDVTQKLTTSGTTWFAPQEGRMVKSQVRTITQVTDGKTMANNDVLLEVKLEELREAKAKGEAGLGLKDTDAGYIVSS